jgi:3-dehydroquinate dehydratase
MGRLGVRSRTEGFRHGSILTYAALRRAVAPGQLTVAEAARAVRASARRR